MRIGSNNIESDKGREFRPRYNYLEFYRRILGTPLVERKYPWFVTYCPFHNDKKTPNLNVNVLSGNYKCFACSAAGGAYNFIVQELHNGREINIPEAVTDPNQIKQIDDYENSREYSKELDEITLLMEARRADSAHLALFQQPLALQMIQRDRGLTIESIYKWKLGFLQGAVTIPIPDITGKIANLKFHKKFSTDHAKNQLFPWEAVVNNRSPYVLLVEGEFDMMICRQNGFNACTQTFGANTWTDEFSKFVRHKTTYIAYDNDQPGKDAAINTGRSIWKEHGLVYVLQWPDFMKNKEDHIDFFVKYGQTAEDYKKLLSKAVNIMNI